jgi:hypothetical protein
VTLVKSKNRIELSIPKYRSNILFPAFPPVAFSVSLQFIPIKNIFFRIPDEVLYGLRRSFVRFVESLLSVIDRETVKMHAIIPLNVDFDGES